MQTTEKKIWFPAKKYGWGWGLPCAWQGWVVLAVFVVLLGGGALVLQVNRHPILWFAYTLFLVAALILVSLAKGEKPRWRWGKE